MHHTAGGNYKSRAGRRTSRTKGFVGNKIERILKEGVRRNTRKPLSKSNPRRKVPLKQAVAIALSMARKKGIKAGRSVAIHKGQRYG